ncbi:MAG: hypothetical protein SPG84_05470 [Vescimonas sp.]|uniref:hypothetical protein n=1 Tax=Vescimonas sp. TaxID=2892404 RepID=UPI002A909C48|nr:hypothetical protein [Vescimonas sp.]MDY5334318.1 hypothetical protein [Vescimonas sp.]
MTVTFSVIDGQTGVCNFEIIKYTFTDGDEGEIETLPAGSIGTASVTISGGVTPPQHTCTLTKVPAKAATCTEDGNIEYYQCSDTTCGKLYKDAAGTQEITKADIVIKAGHTDLKLYPAKEPTCDSDGCVAYWFCTGCDNYYFDNNGAVGEKTTVEKVAIPATGHKWVLVVGGYEEGAPNHTIRCSVCGQKKDEAHADRPGDKSDKWESDKDNHWNVYGCGTIMNKAAHTWNAGVETTPATCTKAGVKTFTCTKCGYEKTEPIAVIAHKYEWKHDETNHWQECSVCGNTIDKAAHTFDTNNCAEDRTCNKCGFKKTAGEHSWNAGEVTTPATCTTDGVKTYTCKVCSETKTEPIAALGHAYGEPAWNLGEDGKTATATFTCTREGCTAETTGHAQTVTATVSGKQKVAPTCTDKGTTTYTATVTFEGKNYSATKDVEDIAKIAHTLTATPAKAATCTEAGNNAYWTCDTCGQVFKDEQGTQPTTVDAETIKALGHDFTGAWVNTDAAGHYHKCTRCDVTDTVVKHTYSGKPCTDADNCTVCGYVKAPGVHAWGAAEYKWSDDYKSCTATVKCTNCEAVETDVAFIGISTTPATCTVDGKTVYTATFSSNLFTTQTKEVTIDKQGHTYGTPVWSWSEDGKTATATFTCTREGCTAETTGHAQNVTATVSGKQKVAPTCTDKGTTTYTAKVTFETKDYTDTKDVQDIKALGHKLTKTEAKAATCTEPGNNEYWTCSVCKKVFKADKTTETTVAAETLAAPGHKLTETPAVTPTCAAGGNNAYWTCSVCHKVFKADKTTETTVAKETLAKDPANHTGGTEQRGAVAASCMTAGRTADIYCKGCGEKLSKDDDGKIIPATGIHNYVDGVCTTCGSKQPADNATIKAAIEKVVADVKEAVEEVLDKAIENETDANTKEILKKLKGYVSGSSRSKLQAVYSVTMSLNGQDLGKGDSLADGQNVTIAISEETYNALKSGAKIVESYLDDKGVAQTREINATLKQVGDGYTVTFAADKTAAYGLMTRTSSGGSGSGSSYTSGQSFTTDLPADSINRVTVNGKKLDSKYYTVSSNGSGSIVTLTDAYLATLKAGKYTVKIENKTHVSTGTFTIKADGTLSSPKTADAGIALYAMLAVSSLMGTAVVSKKRRKA